MCWKPTEERTIPAFCSTLAAIEERPVTIVSKPDCRSGGCDAIIDRSGVRVALEHTTVDSFEEQRHWEEACGPVLQKLEENIRRAHPGVAVDVVLEPAVVKRRRDWKRLAAPLTQGCLAMLGRIGAGERQTVRLPGVPFTVTLDRRLGTGTAFVIHWTPPDRDGQLVDAMVRAIQQKTKQLAPYMADGHHQTVLVIESGDEGLMDRCRLAAAFEKAAGIVGGVLVDEVYACEGFREPPWFYPIKRGDLTYPNVPDFDDWFHIQARLHNPQHP